MRSGTHRRLIAWRMFALGMASLALGQHAQAATKSWKALLFGSFDSANFITVDKSPGALWVIDIAARLFGVNSWSILVPQALEGVAAVLGLVGVPRLHGTTARRSALSAAVASHGQ